MKLLYITLSNPRLGESGIYPDLCNELKRRGHEVTIVYAAGSSETEKTTLAMEHGFRVLKVKTGDNFGVGFVKKGINILMLEPTLIKAIKNNLSADSFDMCIYATPPVTFAGVVSYCKKKYKLKTFLMLKDIFPQNAVDINLFSKKSPVYSMFRSKEKKLYRISDVIGTMSEANRKYVKDNNLEVDEDKLIIFPNTIKVPELDSANADSDLNNHLNNKPVRFVFGGNLGKPQAIDYLIKAISDERVQRLPAEFIFVGEGSEMNKVKEAAEKISNLTFVNHLPKAEYDKFMSGCDVGIISLDSRFTIPNYPSRILGYMSMAKPVLACTDDVTDIRELVEEEAECGCWCSSDSVDGFYLAVKSMTDNRDKLKELGLNGRKYLKDNFNVERSVNMLEEALGQLDTKEKYNV